MYVYMYIYIYIHIYTYTHALHVAGDDQPVEAPGHSMAYYISHSIDIYLQTQ